MLNYKHQRVGGIHFFRLGFLCVSFCVSRKGYDTRPRGLNYEH